MDFNKEELMADLDAADRAGDTELAQHIAGLLKQQQGGSQEPVMTTEETDAGGLAGFAGVEPPKITPPQYGPGEVVKDIPRAVVHGAADILDFPGAVGQAFSDADKAMLGFTRRFLPEGAQGVLEAGSKLAPPTSVLPEPGKFERIASKITDEPKTVPGKAAQVAAGITGVGKLTKVPKMLSKLRRLSGEKAAVKETVKRLRSSDMSPSQVNRELGLEDLTIQPNFSGRFPSMQQFGVKNADEAADTAGQLYNRIPKIDGFSSRLDAFKLDPQTGLSYAQAFDEAMMSTPDFLLPQKLVKKLQIGKGPYTVRDRYLAAKALRKIMQTTNDAAKKSVLYNHLKLLQKMEVTKGESTAAADAIKQADALWTEAMRAREAGRISEEASKLGRTYKEGLVTGKPKVKAVDVLVGMDKFGDKGLERMFGPNYRRVQQALREIGQEELTNTHIGMLGKLVGGVFDWRVIAFLTGGGKVVGTAPYHAAKAVKKTLKHH